MEIARGSHRAVRFAWYALYRRKLANQQAMKRSTRLHSDHARRCRSTCLRLQLTVHRLDERCEPAPCRSARSRDWSLPQSPILILIIALGLSLRLALGLHVHLSLLNRDDVPNLFHKVRTILPMDRRRSCQCEDCDKHGD